MASTPYSREGVATATKNGETSHVYMVANPSIREGAGTAAKNETKTNAQSLQMNACKIPNISYQSECYQNDIKVRHDTVFKRNTERPKQVTITIAIIFVVLFLCMLCAQELINAQDEEKSELNNNTYKRLLLDITCYFIQCYGVINISYIKVLLTLCVFLEAIIYQAIHVFYVAFQKDVYFDTCFSEAFESSTNYNEISTNLTPLKKYRSRYAKFVSRFEVEICAIHRRDREPSRLPVKQLTRLFNKSHCIRTAVRRHIKKAPMSSKIHHIKKHRMGKKLLLDEDNRCLCKPRKYSTMKNPPNKGLHIKSECSREKKGVYKQCKTGQLCIVAQSITPFHI